MTLRQAPPFVFLPIPKAAGATTRRELGRLRKARLIRPAGPDSGEFASARQARADLGETTWGDAFVFSFVRSPYARAYSIWKHLRGAPDDPHHALAAHLTFAEFVAADEVLHGAVEIARPQAHWLRGEDGRVADGVDVIGRVETFRDDFSRIVSAIAGKPVNIVSDARANASTTAGEWRKALTYHAKTAIEEAYAIDFALFGYDRILQAEAA